MKKFFGDSCLPQCGDDEKGFSMLVASDANCPTDISKGNRKEFKEVAVRPNDFCDAEVIGILAERIYNSHYGNGLCQTW